MSILEQKYYGDITIIPSIPIQRYFQLVANPKPELVNNFMIAGERATWPRTCFFHYD